MYTDAIYSFWTQSRRGKKVDKAIYIGAFNYGIHIS